MMLKKRRKKKKKPVPVNEKKIDLSGGLVLKYTVILLLQLLALLEFDCSKNHSDVVSLSSHVIP